MRISFRDACMRIMTFGYILAARTFLNFDLTYCTFTTGKLWTKQAWSWETPEMHIIVRAINLTLDEVMCFTYLS